MENELVEQVEFQLKTKLTTLGVPASDIRKSIELADRTFKRFLTYEQLLKNSFPESQLPHEVTILQSMEAHYAFELCYQIKIGFATSCKVAKFVVPFMLAKMLKKIETNGSNHSSYENFFSDSKLISNPQFIVV